MRSNNQDVYVIGSARVPFTKSMTFYSHVTRKQLMVAALNGLVEKYGLQGRIIGDTAIGAIMLSAADWNLARECLLDTAVHPHSPAYNVQRACGTGFETTWQIAMKIHTGVIDIGIAGGVDTNSDLPVEVSEPLRHILLDLHQAKTFGEKLKIISQFKPKYLKPKFANSAEPRTGLTMGDHCELMVKEWKINRRAQDEFALTSHFKGSKAYSNGFYDDLVLPYRGLTRDSILREDTSLEKLAKLKPAFDKKNGTLTAGNSTLLTDGAASVLLASKNGATQLGVKPLAKIIDVEPAAIDFVKGEGLLMAPTIAVAQLLTRNRLTFADFDYFEIHEAFAGQVLCTLTAWESADYSRNVLGLTQPLGTIDANKLNVVGSSLALGHPFAATGARLAGTMAKLLSSGGQKRGLISICTAGGMGLAAIMESVD